MSKKQKVLVAIIIFIPGAVILGKFLPVPTVYSDFMALYHALLGWSKGFSFYDFATQQNLMFSTTQTAKTNFSIDLFPYFPYPIWYAGATFFLAWLPFDWAYRTWMIINIGMLMLSANLLTDEQPVYVRGLSMIAAIFYPPSIGLLIVGNYTLPVLLGSALFLYAVRKTDPLWAALGLGLLTFKPHIGILLALFGVGWLWFQKTDFSRRALALTLRVGLALILISFVIEPQWFIRFPLALYEWQTATYIRTCTYCSSPTNIIMRLLNYQTGPLSSTAISLILLAIAGAFLWFRRTSIFKHPTKMMPVIACLTTVGLPYMGNYDFVLLLLPLITTFFSSKISLMRIFLFTLYLISWVGIAMDRVGNVVQPITGVVLFAMLLFPLPLAQAKPVLTKD